MKILKVSLICILLTFTAGEAFAKLKCYKVRYKNKYKNTVHITYMEAHSKRLAKTKVSNNGPVKYNTTKVLGEVSMTKCGY